MRLARPTHVAFALAITAALVAVPVMAHAPGADRSAPGADRSAPGDPCDALRATVDLEETRFACARDGADVWAAWVDPPASGAPDLVLNLVHVGSRGTRTTRSDQLPGAAAWFPTIAPIVIAPSESGATVDVVRVGFRSYPVAHRSLSRSQ
jgi:hypothetical protein